MTDRFTELDVVPLIASIGRIEGAVILRDNTEKRLDLDIATASAEVNAQLRKLETIPRMDEARATTERQLLRALKMRLTDLLTMKAKQDGA